MRERRWCLFFGAALLALAFCGCGAKVVKVNGKIVANGKPLVVSSDTYVTLSFFSADKAADDRTRTSYNAKFDPTTGTYSVELPPGKYKTMLIVVPPNPKSGGKLSAPPRPIASEKSYDLSKNQELDIAIPAR